ncbi:MAG: TIGR03435 family protein [Vicinamibacterales bacterium]
MRALIAIGLAVAASSIAGGAVATPAFEVASVRANPSPRSPYSMRWSPNGQFRATNITPRRLIDVAYELRTDIQLVGAPRWITSEGFDIDALAPVAVVPPPQRPLMLQGLLRDRFGLIMRAQPVNVPVYALVRVRPDLPLPRTIRELTVNCTVERLDPAIIIEREQRGEPPSPLSCGMRHDRERGRIVSAGGQISTLINLLRPMVDRRIVDRTGLTGRYDFEMTWFPDPLAGRDIAAANAGIFTAIQELGLKLQPALSPEQGYVIERIQRPTPN